LFIARLQDIIWKELMKNTYANFWATYKAAFDLEVIQEESKPVNPVTEATITNDLSKLTVVELEAVNAI
jgi:hypothetical protein